MKIPEFFLKMLNAIDPTVSSARFLSVVTILTIIYVWAFISVWLRVMQEIPTGVYVFAMAVLAGGGWNKYIEKDKADRPGSTTTETSTTTTTK